jgi:hypothetical protein
VFTAVDVVKITNSRRPPAGTSGAFAGAANEFVETVAVVATGAAASHRAGRRVASVRGNEDLRTHAMDLLRSRDAFVARHGAAAFQAKSRRSSIQGLSGRARRFAAMDAAAAARDSNGDAAAAAVRRPPPVSLAAAMRAGTADWGARLSGTSRGVYHSGAVGATADKLGADRVRFRALQPRIAADEETRILRRVGAGHAAFDGVGRAGRRSSNCGRGANARDPVATSSSVAAAAARHDSERFNRVGERLAKVDSDIFDNDAASSRE